MQPCAHVMHGRSRMAVEREGLIVAMSQRGGMEGEERRSLRTVVRVCVGCCRESGRGDIQRNT